MGSLARALEGFFTARGLALPTDQEERLAAGRRRRRTDAVPGAAAPGRRVVRRVHVQGQGTGLRAGTVPREDETIETALATVRDLARFMDRYLGKRDRALADVHDIEAFLVTLPKGRKRRLTVLRQFFRFARAQKIVLTDPTCGLSARQPAGFTGQTLLLARQRELFRRWTADPDAHPAD